MKSKIKWIVVPVGIFAITTYFLFCSMNPVSGWFFVAAFPWIFSSTFLAYAFFEKWKIKDKFIQWMNSD